MIGGDMNDDLFDDNLFDGDFLLLTDDDADRHLFGTNDDGEDELVAILSADFALDGDVEFFEPF